MMDLRNIETQRKDLLFRGAMGTTGCMFNISFFDALSTFSIIFRFGTLKTPQELLDIYC